MKVEINKYENLFYRNNDYIFYENVINYDIQPINLPDPRYFSTEIGGYLLNEDLTVTLQIEKDNYQLTHSYSNLSFMKCPMLLQEFTPENLQKYIYDIKVRKDDQSLVFAGILDNKGYEYDLDAEEHQCQIKSYTKFYMDLWEEMMLDPALLVSSPNVVDILISIISTHKDKYDPNWKTANGLNGNEWVGPPTDFHLPGDAGYISPSQSMGSLSLAQSTKDAVAGLVVDKNTLAKFGYTVDPNYYWLFSTRLEYATSINRENLSFYTTVRQLRDAGLLTQRQFKYVKNRSFRQVALALIKTQGYVDADRATRIVIKGTSVNKFIGELCKQQGLYFYIDFQGKFTLIPRNTFSKTLEIDNLIEGKPSITFSPRDKVSSVNTYKIVTQTTGNTTLSKFYLVDVLDDQGKKVVYETEIPPDEVTLGHSGGSSVSDLSGTRTLGSNYFSYFDDTMSITLAFDGTNNILEHIKPQLTPDKIYDRFRDMLRPSTMLKCTIATTDVEVPMWVKFRGTTYKVTRAMPNYTTERTEIEAFQMESMSNPFS